MTALPNLLSLSRIPLGFIGLFALSNRADQYGLVAIGVCVAAAVTDWLDGILARQTRHITTLGVAIDPLADKIFAAIMVIGLILYRDFPLWLAFLIVGRDLLIVGIGSWLMRRYAVRLPSNLYGKYAFAFLLSLILSETIRFPFGISLLLPITVILLVLSFLSYAEVGIRVLRGETLQQKPDSAFWLFTRVAFVSTVVTWYLVELWRFLPV